MKVRRATLQFGESTIEYRIVPTPGRRTMGITVTKDGDVYVKSPKGIRSPRIAQAVQRKGSWIISKLEQRKSLPSFTPTRMVSGECVRYLGRQYKLKVIRETKAKAQLIYRNGRFELTVPRSWGHAKTNAFGKESLRHWYQERLKVWAHNLASRRARQLGKTFSDIRIRDLGQRWASCGKRDILYFHWKLARAPLPVIDYVVAHEVCHLVYKKHSKVFWRTLDKLMPDWRQFQGRLDVEGSILGSSI